jgi:ATP-dependent DNA helicase RecQ
VLGHLVTQIELGKKLDTARLVPPERYQIIVNALLQVGDERLKPVWEFLGGTFSYDEIRVVRAVERQGQVTQVAE